MTKLREPLMGIDLGTTNTRAAVVDGDGRVQVLRSFTGLATVPSVVSMDKNGNPFVGERAKRRAVLDPENTIAAAKRLIGRRFDSPECARACGRVGYAVVRSGGAGVAVKIRGRVVSLEEVSALVLSEIKRLAEKKIGKTIRRAVITVPAYFRDRQRQATRDAGAIAGLDVLRVLNEPTAAAIAFRLSEDETRRLAIFDLGGGTFDVSILEIDAGVAEVRATGGDSFLGGEDFDNAIVDYLAVGMQADHGIDVRENLSSRQRLKDAAERAKCELSSTSSTTMHIPYLARVEDKIVDLRQTLRRNEVEPLIAPFIERTEEICRNCLKSAGMSQEDLDEVLLVGGQTRMPAVRRAVEKFFGKEPSKAVNPDEAVALGAARYAKRLVYGEEAGGGILLVDGASHSLGVSTHDGKMAVVIAKDTPLPARGEREFTTADKHQKAVSIRVYQGEADLAELNEPLGEAVLEGLEEGAPRIDVTFDLNSDGITRVSAKERATGKACRAKLVPTSGLTSEEIQEAAGRLAQFRSQVDSAI